MELRWLDDFCALARTRHFSRAADEQNVTQPTFSRRIKMLEEEMGVMLVNRNTLPLSLTPAGERFLTSCEQITRMLKETKEQCREMERAEASKLRFATSQSLYVGFFPRWIASLDTEQELSTQLKSTAWMGQEFVQALQQGRCDLILCYWHPSIEFLQPLAEPEFQYLTVAQEWLAPMTSLNARGEPKFRLPGTARQPLPYISYNDKTFISQVLADHFREHNLEPNLLSVNENSQSVSVKAMVAEGYGLGWLPENLLGNGGQQGLVPAGDGPWRIPVEIRIYRRRDSVHPQMAAFWSQVQRSLAMIEKELT